MISADLKHCHTRQGFQYYPQLFGEGGPSTTEEGPLISCVAACEYPSPAFATNAKCCHTQPPTPFLTAIPKPAGGRGEGEKPSPCCVRQFTLQVHPVPANDDDDEDEEEDDDDDGWQRVMGAFTRLLDTTPTARGLCSTSSTVVSHGKGLFKPRLDRNLLPSPWVST